jgi:hypothetical protein
MAKEAVLIEELGRLSLAIRRRILESSMSRRKKRKGHEGAVGGVPGTNTV